MVLALRCVFVCHRVFPFDASCSLLGRLCAPFPKSLPVFALVSLFPSHPAPSSWRFFSLEELLISSVVPLFRLLCAAAKALPCPRIAVVLFLLVMTVCCFAIGWKSESDFLSKHVIWNDALPLLFSQLPASVCVFALPYTVHFFVNFAWLLSLGLLLLPPCCCCFRGAPVALVWLTCLRD